MHTIFNEDNISGLHDFGKLPQSCGNVLVVMLIAVSLLQSDVHLGFIGIGSHIACFLPANGHDAFFVELVPVGGVVSGGVGPIVNGDHIIVRHGTTVVLITGWRGRRRENFSFLSLVLSLCSFPGVL